MTPPPADRIRRALRWLAALRHWRLVQADDPIGLMFRHPPDDDTTGGDH